MELGVWRISRLVNTSRVLGRCCVWRGHRSSMPFIPHLTISLVCISSICLFLSCHLYNKLVIISIAVFWVLWVVLANYWNWSGDGVVHKNLQFSAISDRSISNSVINVCNLVLRWGQSYETKLLIYEVCTNSA